MERGKHRKRIDQNQHWFGKLKIAINRTHTGISTILLTFDESFAIPIHKKNIEKYATTIEESPHWIQMLKSFLNTPIKLAEQ